MYPSVDELTDFTRAQGNDPRAKHEDRAARIKTSISRINKQINRLQLLQHHDRHRQQLHSELNRNSHNGLVYGSIAETIVYIVTSLFQVIDITIDITIELYWRKSKSLCINWLLLQHWFMSCRISFYTVYIYLYLYICLLDIFCEALVFQAWIFKFSTNQNA